MLISLIISQQNILKIRSNNRILCSKLLFISLQLSSSNRAETLVLLFINIFIVSFYLLRFEIFSASNFSNHLKGILLMRNRITSVGWRIISIFLDSMFQLRRTPSLWHIFITKLVRGDKIWISWNLYQIKLIQNAVKIMVITLFVLMLKSDEIWINYFGSLNKIALHPNS